MKRSTLYAAAIVLAGAQCIWPQQAITFASLSGYVEDGSGAAVRKLELSITHKDRNQSKTALTGDDGRYQFLYLPPGEYELNVSDPRFIAVKRSLSLSVGQSVDVPVRLTVAGASQSVTVVDTPVALEAGRTQVSDVVN